MIQQQRQLQCYTREQHRFGSGNNNTPQPPTPAAQPVAPPAPNPTVTTGDNQIAQDTIAQQAQQKAEASSVLPTDPVTQANQNTAKKTILGG